MKTQAELVAEFAETKDRANKLIGPTELTVSEACEIYEVSGLTIRNGIRSGALKARKLSPMNRLGGAPWVMKLSDLDKWIKTRLKKR